MADTLELYEDFENGFNWSNTGHWTSTTVGTTTVTVGSGKGNLQASTTSSAALMVPIVGNAENYDIKFRAYANTSTTSRYSLIFGWGDSPTITSGNFDVANGAYISGSTWLPVAKRNGALKMGTSPSGFTLSTSNAALTWIRMRKEGTVLYLKRWNEPNSEPGSWDLTWDMGTDAPDTASMTSMKPFIAVEGNYTSAAGVTVDDFYAYSVSTVLNGGYTAQPMTATGLMGNHAVVKNVNYAVPALTATGSMPNASAATKNATFGNFQANGTSSGSPDTNYNATRDVFNLAVSTSEEIFLGMSGVSLPVDAVIASAVLTLNLQVITSSPVTFKPVSIDAAYDPDTLTWNNKPSTGAIQVASKTFSTTGDKTFDVSSIVPSLLDGTAKGIALVATSGRAALDVTGGSKPTLAITYASDGGINVVVLPFTGSALMVDPTFSNATNKTVNVAAATATALALDPAVSVVRFVDYAVEPFVATGLGPQGGFSVPTAVAVSPATASGTALDASVTTERNAVVSVPASISTGVLPGILLEINGEIVNPELASDLYRAEILATTDSDDFWYRLDESSGSTIYDARGVTAKNATLFGGYSFGIYGPESRKAIHMDNGYFAPNVNGTPDGRGGIDSESTSNMAFEVVLRTTDGNGVLAYGLDNKFQNAEFRNAIYLKDGKVSIEWNRLDAPTFQRFSLTGFKNVADGQWHHIVVTSGARSAKELDNGVRVYIDGKLDVRRRTELIPDGWATPDSYLGMPEAWRMVTPLYPWQDNLTADVMEVVFRKDSDLWHDQVIELYYDAFGIVPVRVPPATATGVMPDAVGKGNKKRALVLYTRWYGAGNTTGSLAGFERNAPSGASTTIPDEFDHEIAIGRIPEPGEYEKYGPMQIAGFTVEAVSIMQEDTNPLAGPYRDPVTDLPRLLNLQEDLNLDEYDLIMFRNWPDEGADQEVFRQRGYDNQAIRDFLDSVKEAVVVQGRSLEVTSPALAASLGLISGAQPIPMAVDRNEGVNAGENDKRASQINPWDVDKIGNTYLDIHANNWHRVVASVEGLTDSPTEIRTVDDEQVEVPLYERIAEAYLTYNYGTNGQVNNQWGYKLEAGDLQIGDELIDPVQFWNRVVSYDQSNLPTEKPWDKYLWAITPDGLSVGTPLYKFGSKMWQGNTEVDNPYREFIGGAIVQPGDVWDGQQVGGRVFINLAESPFSALKSYEVMTRQLVPPNEELPDPNAHEDATKREWDYSMNRVAFTAKAIGNGPNQANPHDPFTGTLVEQAVKKDGTVYYKAASPSVDQVLVGIEITEKYEVEPVVTPSWALRGLAWLATRPEFVAGSATVRPVAITATGEMPSPVVDAQKSVSIVAQTAIAVGVMVSPDEVVEPDVKVLVFPAEASGVMTGYAKTIAVAPFEGYGLMVENFDQISAGGEQVVLFLFNENEIELYLKEDK